MSLIASLISSAAGGAILGGFGQAANNLMEIWRANAESKRKIAEANALAQIKVEESSWACFQETLKSRNSSFAMPQNATVWQNWVFIAVEAIVRLMNPILTLGAIVILWNFYHSLDAEAQREFFPEISAWAFACTYWWIGQRAQGKLQPGKAGTK